MLDSVIITVYKKDNLDELVKGLYEVNSDIKILSSEGTGKKIRELGFGATDISLYTGFPESPEGLVKTLHPKVHAGILLDRDKPSEREYLEENNIKSIDLVVCNLYPFFEKKEVENIDIGGFTLIRSAAKGALRHGEVAPVVYPKDYRSVVEELRENKGTLKRETVDHLVHKAFTYTYYYEKEIKNWLKVK